MEIKLRETTYHLLVEAFYNVEDSVDVGDLDWTFDSIVYQCVLLSPGVQAQPAFNDGMLMPEDGGRNDKWWALTRLGAQILLRWHNLGYNKQSELPPWDVEVTSEPENELP